MQKQQLLNHQQSIMETFFPKTHIFYITCSCSFWMIITGISWFRFSDPFFGSVLSFYKIDSINYLFNFTLSLTFIVGMCVIVGFFLSIPAMLTRSLFDIIIFAERKKYKRVFYLVFAAQYLPFILLFMANALFYYANQSSQIESRFLYNSKLKKIAKNYEQVGDSNPNGYYIFLIPEYLLENNMKLLTTKSILPFGGDIFLETIAKPEIVSLLIQNDSQDLVQYYAPISIQNIPNIEVSSEKVSIGVDRKTTPEFLNLFSKNILGPNKFHLTKSTILSNHAMAYLKPVHLILKTNLFGIFSKNWRWDNYGNSSTDILFNHSNRLIQKNPAKYNFVLISDLRPNIKKSLFFGSSDFFNQKEILDAEILLDKNLSVVIKSLLKTGANRVAILPYHGGSPTFKTSKFFTSIPMDANLKSYRTFFAHYSDETVCKTQYMPNIDHPIQFDQKIVFDNLKFSKKGEPYLNPEYNLYIKRFFSNALVCYINQNSIYVVNKKKSNNLVNIQDETLITNNFDIYKISAHNTPYLLTREEKSSFIYKYKNEIFK